MRLALASAGAPQAAGRTPRDPRCPGAETVLSGGHPRSPRWASRTAILRASGTTKRSAREGGQAI
jgi:hypothetical protein